jgi:hypothetical protein
VLTITDFAVGIMQILRVRIETLSSKTKQKRTEGKKSNGDFAKKLR